MKKVYITGSSSGIGKAAAELFTEKGFSVFPIIHDATLPEKIDADILINCAGVDSYAQLQDITDEEYKSVFDANFKFTMDCCKAAAGHMIEMQQGSIVNIASIWGETGASCESLYAASKGAVIAFTKSLAKELFPSGIRVNCVSPGCIDTPMLRKLGSEAISSLGALGTAQQVADAIYFLAMNEFITGQILRIDGGFTL